MLQKQEQFRSRHRGSDLYSIWKLNIWIISSYFKYSFFSAFAWVKIIISEFIRWSCNIHFDICFNTDSFLLQIEKFFKLKTFWYIVFAVTVLWLMHQFCAKKIWSFSTNMLLVVQNYRYEHMLSHGWCNLWKRKSSHTMSNVGFGKS